MDVSDFPTPIGLERLLELLESKLYLFLVWKAVRDVDVSDVRDEEKKLPVSTTDEELNKFINMWLEENNHTVTGCVLNRAKQYLLQRYLRTSKAVALAIKDNNESLFNNVAGCDNYYKLQDYDDDLVVYMYA